MTLHTALLLYVILGCIWLITSHRVQTGVVITVGLVLVACGCLGMLDEFSFTQRAYALRTDGLALIFWGLMWRQVILPWWRRRLPRWGIGHMIARHAGVERRQGWRNGG